MKRYKIILLAIIALALFLRVFRLSDVPPGVNQDEASIGFTAYSLLQTGRDEYGHVLPLSFQSFGDWKLPLYIYTTIPFVATLGMSELAVRLPSTIAGILTVIVAFFLVYELFRSYRLSLLASLLLAISPWHLHLSRVESESNVAVFFTATGFLLLLKGLHKHWLAVPGAILLALTYYTYHGNHISTTLLLIGFIALYWREAIKPKAFFYGALLFIVLAGFILSQTLAGADRTKLSGIGLLGDPFVIHERIELPRNDHGNDSLTAVILHNRITYAIETITKNYLKAFSPEFLFISGGTNRAHNIPNFGNMYLIEAPFLLLGLFVCIANRKKKPFLFLLWWILVSPVAASITRDAPHTNRMFAIFPALPIVVALGLNYFFNEISFHKKSIVIGFVMMLFMINIVVYMDRYYVHFPKNEAPSWGIGYKELLSYIDQPLQKSKTLIMANPETSPYIFLLFYGKDDPALFQQKVERYDPTPDGFYHVRVFGRYQFRQIDWERDIFYPNALLVDYVERVPDQYKPRMIRVAQFGVVPSYL